MIETKQEKCAKKQAEKYTPAEAVSDIGCKSCAGQKNQDKKDIYRLDKKWDRVRKDTFWMIDRDKIAQTQNA